MPKMVLSFRIDPALKSAIERIARADGRSVSNLIEKLLTEFVAAEARPKHRRKE